MYILRPIETNRKCEKREKAEPFLKPPPSSPLEGTKDETFQEGSVAASKRRAAAKRVELEMEMEKRVWKRVWWRRRRRWKAGELRRWAQRRQTEGREGRVE